MKLVIYPSQIVCRFCKRKVGLTWQEFRNDCEERLYWSGFADETTEDAIPPYYPEHHDACYDEAFKDRR